LWNKIALGYKLSFQVFIPVRYELGKNSVFALEGNISITNSNRLLLEVEITPVHFETARDT